MKKVTLFKRYFFAAVALLLLNNQSSMSATSAADYDQKTARALEFFKQGKTAEAVDLEKKAVKEKPSDWLPHATLSYFQWYSGEMKAAISEAKFAARLAPDIESVQTNLGRMALDMGDYQIAVDAFESATKIAPDDWAPWFGLVKSHLTNGHKDIALACLREMMAQSNKPFAWFHQISEMSLQIGEPKMADEVATKALSLALTPEQKSLSSAQLLLALLRSNQLERANAMKEQVFNEGHPDNIELYLRAASALLPAEDPLAGKQLLDSALKNLDDKLNSDGFFRLGSIFEEKARQAVDKHSNLGAWNDYAETAYRKAIALGPDRSFYHLAVAGVLDRQGKTDEMAEELSKAQLLNKFDLLAPFLLGRLKKDLQNHPIAQDASAEWRADVNLTKVDFKVIGLNCGCKLSKVRVALSKIDGVAFVATVSKKPYRGTMLIDESTTKINDVLSQCAQNAVPANVSATSPTAAQVQPEFTLEIDSRKQGMSVDDAIRVELTAMVGDLSRIPIKTQHPIALTPLTLDHPRVGGNIAL